MRRFMIVLAVATTLAAGAIGRAEGELATCSGVAPGARACSKSFTLTETMAVDLGMVPAVGYTGTLKARILKGNLTVATVGAYFFAGQAVPLAANLPVQDTRLLDAGQYTLKVESAKFLKPCDAGAIYAACQFDVPVGDTLAVGEYAAAVTPTDAVA